MTCADLSMVPLTLLSFLVFENKRFFAVDFFLSFSERKHGAMDREGNPRAIKSCSSLPISFLHQPPAHACTDSLCSFCAESSAIHRHDVDTNTNYSMLLARRHAMVSVHTPHTFKPTLEAMHHWLCVHPVCPLHAYFGRVVSDTDSHGVSRLTSARPLRAILGNPCHVSRGHMLVTKMHKP